MPLDVDDFDRVAVKITKTKLGINQTKIVDLLRYDLENAYTQSEIKEKTGIEFDAAVNTALHSLKIKGLVESKRVDGYIYWRGTDRLLNFGAEDKTDADV